LSSQKVICFAVCAWLLAFHASAQAQPSQTFARIGYVFATSSSVAAPRVESFQQGLRELGYVEGKNILIDWRYAENERRLASLTAELLHLKVNVIVTGGGVATRSAKEATSTVPIVMTQDTDPVANGFVTSLARPGGNITGLSTLAPEVSGKRLELLKEIVPSLSRVAVFGNSPNPGNRPLLKETELAAASLGVMLQHFDVITPKDIEPAFRAASNGRADAVLVLTGSVFSTHRKQLIELAAKRRLPTMYHRTHVVEDGGLMYYGVNYNDLSRRAATYVDKILKGAKPAELPVEQPEKFELIMNMKSAKQIGLTIPPNVLARADKVIK
jgi:putative tryptophan/tyrosine transport system substrate-binding protein